MIPLCWKCANRITEPDVTGHSRKLTGCKECTRVTDYPTALIFCPLHPQQYKPEPKTDEP